MSLRLSASAASGAEWPRVPLGAVLGYRKEFVHIDDVATYKRCRVQLHANGVVLRDVVAGAEVKTKSQQVCRAGDFLVAEIDAKVGGFGMVPSDLDGAIVSSHYFLFSANATRLDRRFLDLYARTSAFQDQVKAKGSTNYAAIRPADVLAYTMPLPPLDEQRRIVGRVEALAARIDEARGLRRQAVEEADRVLPAAVGKVYSVRDTRRVPLGDGQVASVIAGQHVLAGDCTAAGIGIPYLTGPADFGQRVASPSRWAENTKSSCLPGDVLVTVKGAGVGSTNLAPPMQTAIGRQVMAVRPTSAVVTEYVYYFLRSAFTDIAGTATATTVPGVKKAVVQGLLIPLLPLPEQRRVVAYLDGLEAKVDALRQLQAQTSAELDALLPSILERAFSGEL